MSAFDKSIAEIATPGTLSKATALGAEFAGELAAAAKGWLSPKEYLQRFDALQQTTVAVTDKVARSLQAGDTESQIADRLQTGLAGKGLNEHWYPILVNAGENSGQPLSRRFHLPSDTKVRSSDITIVDSTPISGTVWANWTRTVATGADPFYKKLVSDADELTEATYKYATTQARNIGDIYDHSQSLMKRLNLTSIDPRSDVGHSIFQVPVGQTVELTPMSQRLFISDEYRTSPIRGIVSIEPNVGRINPADGILYGAKQQRVLIRE